MNTQHVSIYGMLAFALLLLNAVIMETAVFKDSNWQAALYITLPLLVVSIYLHRKSQPVKKEKQSQAAIPEQEFTTAW